MPEAARIDTVGYVILFVKDVPLSVAFYRDTIGVPVRFFDPNWTELDTKGCTVALHHQDGAKAGGDGSSVEVVFQVDDVLGTHASLKSRGVSIEEPKLVHEAGDRVGVSCIFRDPDGNLLSVYGLVGKEIWEKLTIR